MDAGIKQNGRTDHTPGITTPQMLKRLGEAYMRHAEEQEKRVRAWAEALTTQV